MSKCTVAFLHTNNVSLELKKKNTMDNETKKEGKQAGKRGVSSGLTLPDFKASYIATIMVVLVKE
jgi:hypothetical protein